MAKCAYCINPGPGLARRVSFTYKGLAANVFKPSNVCVNCQKDIWAKKFEQYGKTFVAVRSGVPVVNWFNYFVFISFNRLVEKEIVDIINNLLFELDIFSYHPEGRWEIMGTTTNQGMNPSAYDFYLYFSRREDAVQFAYYAYKGNSRDWEVRHIDRVLSSEEIIKEMKQRQEEELK